MRKKLISLLTAMSITLVLFCTPNILATTGHIHKVCVGTNHADCTDKDII